MLGGAQAAAAVCAETRDETDKANKEFDRWSDDDTPQVKATKEREFDAWSEESVEVEQEQKEDQELFFTDAAPDRSLGVSSKHRAPHPSHPSAPQPAEVEVRLSPRPPKAPPPAHLLQAEREAVEWLRKKSGGPSPASSASHAGHSATGATCATTAATDATDATRANAIGAAPRGATSATRATDATDATDGRTGRTGASNNAGAPGATSGSDTCGACPRVTLCHLDLFLFAAAWTGTDEASGNPAVG